MLYMNKSIYHNNLKTGYYDVKDDYTTNSANNNVGIGYLALGASADHTNDATAFTATDNVAVGNLALNGSSATTSHYNVAVGNYTLDGIGSNGGIESSMEEVPSLD